MAAHTQDKQAMTYFSYADWQIANRILRSNDNRYTAEFQVLLDFLRSGCNVVTDPYGFTEGIDEGLAAFRLSEIISYHKVIID